MVNGSVLLVVFPWECCPGSVALNVLQWRCVYGSVGKYVCFTGSVALGVYIYAYVSLVVFHWEFFTRSV